MERVETADDRHAGVRLAGGRLVACDALVVAPAVDAASPVLDELGVARADGGGYAPGSDGATGVAGLWVAGNVADPLATVAAASAQGLAVAAAVNADLVAERVRRAVAARRGDGRPAGQASRRSIVATAAAPPTTR